MGTNVLQIPDAVWIIILISLLVFGWIGSIFMQSGSSNNKGKKGK